MVDCIRRATGTYSERPPTTGSQTQARVVGLQPVLNASNSRRRAVSPRQSCEDAPQNAKVREHTIPIGLPSL